MFPKVSVEVVAADPEVREVGFGAVRDCLFRGTVLADGAVVREDEPWHLVYSGLPAGQVALCGAVAPDPGGWAYVHTGLRRLRSTEICEACLGQVELIGRNPHVRLVGGFENIGKGRTA